MIKGSKMSAVQLSFIILTVIALSVGQVLFKVASESFDLSPDNFIKAIFNVKLLSALTVYFVATVMWLLVLRATPLRVAYPFVALAFVLVPVMAHFILGEGLRWNTFVGAMIIALGVLVSTFQ